MLPPSQASKTEEGNRATKRYYSPFTQDDKNVAKARKRSAHLCLLHDIFYCRHQRQVFFRFPCPGQRGRVQQKLRHLGAHSFISPPLLRRPLCPFSAYSCVSAPRFNYPSLRVFINCSEKIADSLSRLGNELQRGLRRADDLRGPRFVPSSDPIRRRLHIIKILQEQRGPETLRASFDPAVGELRELLSDARVTVEIL